MKNTGTVTVGGSTYTIDDYLAMAADAEKSQELKNLDFVSREVEKYRPALKRKSPQHKLTKKAKTGVIYTKHYTKHEIIKEEFKMGIKSANSIPYQIMLHMAKNPGREFGVPDLIKVFPDVPKGTISGSLSRTMKYLVPEKIVKPRKDGRRTYYTFVAEIKRQEIEDEIIALHDNYLTWDRDKRGKNNGGPQTDLVKKPAKRLTKASEASELVTVANKISTGINQKLNGVSTDLGLNVRVEGKIEILFGLIKPQGS